MTGSSKIAITWHLSLFFCCLLQGQAQAVGHKQGVRDKLVGVPEGSQQGGVHLVLQAPCTYCRCICRSSSCRAVDFRSKRGTGDVVGRREAKEQQQRVRPWQGKKATASTGGSLSVSMVLWRGRDGLATSESRTKVAVHTRSDG